MTAIIKRAYGPRLFEQSDFTDEQAAAYIRAANGSLSAAAREMGVHRNTLTRWLKDWPLAAAELEEQRSVTKERVEHKLIEKALEGDMTAMIFFLKTQAGWRETSRVESVNVNLDVTKLTEDQLRRIASGEDVAAVISGGA